MEVCPSIVTVISPRHSAAVRTEMRRCIAAIELLVAEVEVQHRLHAEMWGGGTGSGTGG